MHYSGIVTAKHLVTVLMIKHEQFQKNADPCFIRNVSKKQPSSPRHEPRQDENYSSSGRIIRPMNVLMYCPTCKKQARVALLNAATREKLRAEIESGTAIQVIHSDTEGDHIWTLSTEETGK